MQRYNPKDIEPRWQQTWKEDGIYKAVDFDERPKFVMLTEFPYPSGDGLHLGHTREYTLGDILARFKRMQGMNVLYPMGYDAFGLPTENYAIKHKIAPQVATDRNVANFQKQFESLGYSIDWSRSFRTSDPEYYKWTQWLFLQFYKAGLAYQDETAINWCPHCKTGLANEEVVNGRHERCDTLVEKKFLKQWLLAITKYADTLIDNLQDIDFPSRIADQQVNWIGRSKGAEIDFAVDGTNEKIRVFTTRPDTLFGATFLVLAPEHPLVEKITTAEQKQHVNTYIKSAQSKTDVERQDTGREKTGVATGAYAINPANGEKIPVWIADYVLTGYGTGGIMAVPAHDERDHAFAEKFGLQIRPVVTPVFFKEGDDIDRSKATDRLAVVAVTHDPSTNKYCLIEWNKDHFRAGLEWPGGGIDEGETVEDAVVREFMEETGYTDVSVETVMPAATSFYFMNSKGETKRNVLQVARLKLNSLANNGTVGTEAYEKDAYKVVWMSYEELEQNLHNMAETYRSLTNFAFDDANYVGEGVMINSGPYDGMSSGEVREKIVRDLSERGVAEEKINYRLRDWIFSRQHYWGEPIPIIHCEEHGAVPVPEDQLPVELPPVEHYEPTDTGESPLAVISEWVDTTCPVCGKPAKRETDTMPNWAGSSWYYMRYFDAHNETAFADRKKLEYWGAVDLYLGGMEHTTLHLLYSRFWHQFFYDQGLVPTPEPYKARRGQGIILAADGSKMSKSKGNVVNPTEVIESGYGADALRLAITFLAPYDQTTAWSPEAVAGTHRFLQRIWTLTQEYLTADQSSADEVHEVRRAVHQTIKKVSEDITNMSFNTAIAAMMELVNTLYKHKAQLLQTEAGKEDLTVLVQLVAPYAPHIAEELWQQLGKAGSIHTSEWPTYDQKYLEQDIATIVVQVNGKLRGDITMPKASSEEEVVAAAKADARVAVHLTDKEIRKTVYVPGRLVNFVV
ncbi:MAG: leucine--tRNA ligase [Candidatus Saccharibacteria bacterium]|nr:leucine--tRNA ligase [Candidatus Saccharibacteria bacterium]